MTSLPHVFLSLSGADEKFVGRVRDDLPEGLAAFYPRSFQNGENLVAAMEDRVGKASIFALFASRSSIDSCWVNFEIDRARVKKIQNPSFRILVFIIDKNVTASDLPEWMREYWAPRAGQSARDIARYIRNVLFSPGFSTSPTGRGYGRGALVDGVNRQVREVAAARGTTPNIFCFAGNSGIGRRTVARQVLEHVFSSAPQINFGPELSLPRFADVADVFRALRQEVEEQFSLTNFQSQLDAFSAASLGAQIDELIRNMLHFAELGQAITLVTGNGLFDAFGDFKPWVSALFSALERQTTIVLVVISNRQIHAKELARRANVIHTVIPALPDDEIRAIMIATAPVFGGSPTPPSDTIVRRIGGHAGLAKAATRLIAQKGIYVLENNPRDLFDIQDDIFHETMEGIPIDSLTGEILCVLSWLPQIGPDILRATLLPRHSINEEGLAISLEQLIVSCLVFLSGSNYSISDPIRHAFRRHYGLGDADLRAALSASIKAAWERSKADDVYRAEVFDGLVFMIGLEGGQLPPEFKRLILPSTLREVLKSTYDLGHDDPDALRRVSAWAMLGLQLPMDDATREEILSYGVRSRIRLDDFDGAIELIGEIEKRHYPSTNFLRGLVLRRQGKIPEAIHQLTEARHFKAYYRTVIQELAICFRQAAMWDELDLLLLEEEQVVERTSYLLDIKIGQLIAFGRFDEADAALARMARLPDEDGRASRRRAHIMMRREQRYEEAVQLLSRLLDRTAGGHVAIRRMRAIAAAKMGNVRLAKEDLAFIQSRAGHGTEALAVEVQLALEARDVAAAEAALSKIKVRDAQTRLLEARILEAKSEETGRPLDECIRLKQQATAIRTRYKSADEFLSDV